MRFNLSDSRACIHLRLPVILALISLLLFISCAGKDKIPLPMHYYTLDYPVPVVEQKAPLSVALLIETFKTAPPYDTAQIIYSTDAFSQNKYHYHQWMARPEEMITRLLARDLMTSGYFKAVVVDGDIAINPHLQGTIEQFYEKDTDERWYAVLSVTVTLMDKTEHDKNRQFCMQKNYTNTCPLNRKNPKSLARAMSTAMSGISRRMITDLYDVLAQNIPR